MGRSMSEVLEGGGVTAGAMLREARQAAGVHIAALAVALKVPVSKLEALEADNYQALPDTVFVRALASSMCRTLKMDPGPVLSLLPQSKSPRLSADGGGLNAPVKGAIGKSSSSSSSSFSSRSASRSVSLTVLALLVGALVLVFLPRQPEESTGSRSAQVPEESKAHMVDPPADAASAVASAPTSLATLAGPAPATSLPPMPGRADVVPEASVPLATNPASAPLDVASAAVGAPAGALVLRARGESWVQVRDATGALALQRNLAAGEVVTIAGPVPLAVVVGRADMTEVLVRGKVFDLTAVTRENVARFEVK